MRTEWRAAQVRIEQEDTVYLRDIELRYDLVADRPIILDVDKSFPASADAPGLAELVAEFYDLDPTAIKQSLQELMESSEIKKGWARRAAS